MLDVTLTLTHSRTCSQNVISLLLCQLNDFHHPINSQWIKCRKIPKPNLYMFCSIKNVSTTDIHWPLFKPLFPKCPELFMKYVT